VGLRPSGLCREPKWSSSMLVRRAGPLPNRPTWPQGRTNPLLCSLLHWRYNRIRRLAERRGLSCRAHGFRGGAETILHASLASDKPTNKNQRLQPVRDGSLILLSVISQTVKQNGGFRQYLHYPFPCSAMTASVILLSHASNVSKRTQWLRSYLRPAPSQQGQTAQAKQADSCRLGDHMCDSIQEYHLTARGEVVQAIHVPSSAAGRKKHARTACDLT
jgi:hypothetical protein